MAASHSSSGHRKRWDLDDKITPGILHFRNLIAQQRTMNQEQVLPRSRQVLFLLSSVLLAINIISAALFITFVNRPVYDDSYNMRDVHTYATNGVSASTILVHKNPAAPGSYIWMAVGARLLPGDELRGARIAALFSWLLLGVGILVGGRLSSFPELWYGALLSTLILPHAVIATSTVLTEGPSLLFATLGALAWTEFVQLRTTNTRQIIQVIAGGLSLGIAVVCRQYCLALLASAVLIFFGQLHNQPKRQKLGGIVLSLVAAVIPVILLLSIWKGITSPAMVSGLPHSKYQASMGLNLDRPFTAAFKVALYLLPLSFPALRHLPSIKHRRVLIGVALLGMMAIFFKSSLVGRGPINSVIHLASRVQAGGILIFGLLAFLAITNLAAVALVLWRTRSTALASCIPLQFALLAILFFVVEQYGVGGNIPFYDRYVLQFAPFLGIIAFSVAPQLTRSRAILFIGLSSASHLLLWSYAFQKY